LRHNLSIVLDKILKFNPSWLLTIFPLMSCCPYTLTVLLWSWGFYYYCISLNLPSVFLYYSNTSNIAFASTVHLLLISVPISFALFFLFLSRQVIYFDIEIFLYSVSQISKQYFMTYCKLKILYCHTVHWFYMWWKVALHM